MGGGGASKPSSLQGCSSAAQEQSGGDGTQGTATEPGSLVWEMARQVSMEDASLHD